MGKSSRRRRELEKRRWQLDELRGVSIVDVPSPSPSKKSSQSYSHSPAVAAPIHQQSQKTDSSVPLHNNAETSRHNRTSDRLPVSPTPANHRRRKRLEFVLPRALGKTDQFAFSKCSKTINEELHTIPEEDRSPSERLNGRHDSLRAESIEDILYPDRKRRRTTGVEEAQAKLNNPPRALSPCREADKSGTDDQGPTNKQGTSMLLKAQVADNGTDFKPTFTDSPMRPHRTTVRDCMNGGRLSGISVEDAIRDKVGLRPRSNSTDMELNLPQRGLCDERMVLEAYQWKLEQTDSLPQGFVNLGNTCFLNSTLQCLSYLPPLCQSLVTISHMKRGFNQNGRKQNQSHGQRITSTLCSLFQSVHRLNKRSSGHCALAPTGIVQALPTLSNCGSRNGYKFRPGRQEDAHEFLVHLLDAMHDGELRSAGINQHISGWRDRLPVPRLDETTFVHRIFGGYLRSQVRCTLCGYCSNTYDPFLDLSLEVSKKSSNSISSAFAEFTRQETLDSANRWKCSGCLKHVCATKQLTIFRPPLSLCIQLKRFTYDGSSGGRGSGFPSHGGGWKYRKVNSWGHRGGSKITKPIEFPMEMDLPLSDGRSCRYLLTGTVIHVGGSASSGHYTACVKKPGRSGSVRWYHVDDSFVEPMSERSVVRQKDAYVLFYSRKEVKLEFPSPPPRGSMSAEEAKELGRARARARADSATSEDSRGRHNNAERNDMKPPATKATLHNSTQGNIYNDGAIVRKLNSKVESNATFPSRLTGAVQYGPLPRTKTRVHPLGSPAPSTQKRGREVRDDKPYDISGFDSRADSQAIKSHRCKESANTASELTKLNDGMEFRQEAALSTHLTVSRASSDKPSVLGLPATRAPLSEAQSRGRLYSAANRSVKLNDQIQSKESSADSSDSDSSSSSDDDADSDQACMATPRDESDGKTSSTQTSSLDSVSKRQTDESRRAEESQRTRVVIEKGDSNSKVEVMLGPRKRRRAWRTKSVTNGGSGSELLGNVDMCQWSDDEDGGVVSATHAPKSAQDRLTVVKQLEKQERSRKRQRQLDRWDALLDQGKKKKTKKKFNKEDFPLTTESPKKNVFQRIQSGFQNLNRGKAKGFLRRNNKASRASF